MNRGLLKRSLAVAVIFSALSTSAWAQSASVIVTSQSSPYPQCGLFGFGFSPGFHVLYVRCTGAGPVGAARFKLQTSSPVTFFNAPPDLEFDLTFNPCVTNAAVELLGVVPAGPFVEITAVPATGHAEIEVTDCDGYEMPATGSCYYSGYVAPYRPNPPDGAVDVPTNQLLSYVGEANVVYIGTSPNLEHVICSGELPCVLPLDPGLLAPNTTYYWQAVNDPNVPQVFGAWSELFSFTTGDAPLAVESSSWGRVKAMYRE